MATKTKLASQLTVALGRTFGKQIPDLKLTPGTQTVNEEVNLRVIGTIEVKEDTEAAPRFNAQLEKVLAVVLGNMEKHFPQLLVDGDFEDEEEAKSIISEALRKDIARALKTCATRPQTIEKNYSKEIIVVEDMLRVAQAAHEKKEDKKVRKGARTFHGTVEIIN